MSENGYCLQEKIEDSECWLCGGMGCDAEMEEMGWDIATLPTREWAKIAVAS